MRYKTFTLFNGTVYNDMGLDAVLSYTYIYDKLLTSGIQVYILDGDFDIMDGPTGTEAWM